jgi:hypothetical protein
MTTKLQWAERDRLHAEGLRGCFTCKEILPESAFYKSNRGSYGLAGVCKECSLEKSRAEYKKKNPDVKPGNFIDVNRSEKPCGQCHQVTPMSDFYKCGSTADGHDSICAPCRRFQNAKFRLDNIDKARATDRRRKRGPRTEAELSYKALYREKYPKRAKVNSVAGQAIRTGILKKQPCEECGSDALKSHAHHDDYNKPLDVRWLCSIHHKEWHMHNEPID